MPSRDPYAPKHSPDIETVPFDDAEQAWFWFMAAQKALNEGAKIRAGNGLFPRACEPVDILKCIERLYRTRQLTWDHILVLNHYGRRQLSPDKYRQKEARAYHLWHEALKKLELTLIEKKLIKNKPGPSWMHQAQVFENHKEEVFA